MSLAIRKIALKKLPRILVVIGFFFCGAFSDTHGQPLNVRIALLPSEVRIQGHSSAPVQSWSFRSAYAGALGLGERIKDFEAIGSAGEVVASRKVASGEYRSDKKVTGFSYSLSLSLPARPGDLSHVSWLTRDHGFLMLADILPEAIGEDPALSQSATMTFELPPGWMVRSTINPNDKDQYLVREPESTVFLVGRSLRESRKTVNSMDVSVLASGDWSAADAEVLKIAGKVMTKYSELTGFKLAGRSAVMLAPLPPSQSTTFWRAETRGSTVILLLDPRAKRENWIAQLGVIFTHEVFHLWVPNSLRLQGAYDWFFEGFTLYEALVTALNLRLISFQEYLNTIARVYDSYLSYPDNLSLIEASEQRWTSAAPLVYDKGMLVAFMYDLLTRIESKGKASLADRYRMLFSSYTAERGDANKVIIDLLNSSANSGALAQSYIEGRKAIDLEHFLPAFGFQIDSGGPVTHLSVSKDINKENQTLLKTLGYKHQVRRHQD